MNLDLDGFQFITVLPLPRLRGHVFGQGSPLQLLLSPLIKPWDTRLDCALAIWENKAFQPHHAHFQRWNQLFSQGSLLYTFLKQGNGIRRPCLHVRPLKVTCSSRPFQGAGLDGKRVFCKNGICGAFTPWPLQCLCVAGGHPTSKLAPNLLFDRHLCPLGAVNAMMLLSHARS